MSKVEKNGFEWCVFGVASVLVLSVLGYLVYDAVTMIQKPAILEVHLGQVERRAHQFAIPVAVFNRGDHTAESVHIEVALMKQDGGEERADFEIAFVPAGAARHGLVTFESDPDAAVEISARAVGYRTP